MLTTIGIVAGATIGYLLITGKEVSPAGLFGGKPRDEPDPCPLTGGLPRSGDAPARPALGVKVENLSVARPQAGLAQADVVFEEPVEGGITRFIAVYQCRDAQRIGPVRSARLVDPDVLVQFGDALLGYAGGVPLVEQKVRGSGLVDLSYDVAVEAYEKDPSRSAPHDQFTSTQALYAFAASDAGSPEAVFAFDDEAPAGARPATTAQVDFSPEADVVWRWRPKKGVWARFHGEEPHRVESGEQIHARNVVIQVVEVRPSAILDAAGNPSPEIDVVGSGPVHVLRDGVVIEGRWVRDAVEDVTRLEDAAGDEIPLAPGTTWVELFPSTRPLEIA